MAGKRAAIVGSMLLAGSIGACSAPAPDPGPSDAIGAAREAYCSGLYVTHVVRRAGTIFYVSPETLATAADGWGPQTLSLSVDQGFDSQLTYADTPSLSKNKNNLTKTVQQAVGFSLTHTVDLTAISAVLVPTDAYYRLEAYPEYQVIDWELHADACSIMPDTLITTGTVYRPVGIHFRVLVYVGGEWNALTPPTPAEQMVSPPWAPAVQNAGSATADAGTGADGGAGSAGNAGATTVQGNGGAASPGGASTPGGLVSPGGAASPGSGHP
jgi:hypothetical protein